MFDPGICFSKGHEMGFADAGNGGEVEGGEGFTVGQMGFIHMTSDPTGGSFENLVLAEGGQEAGGAPSLAIGTFAQILPEAGDGGQPQRGQHQRQLGSIGVGHDGIPLMALTSSDVAAPASSNRS